MNKNSIKLIVFGFIPLLLIPVVAFSGFEIGNGRKVIKNTPGQYELIIPKSLEVGFSSKFTEAITPLFEGTPRAKLQINIIKDAKIGTYSDLIYNTSESNWSGCSLAGFQGIKNEVVLPTRLHQIEYRLFYKEFQVIVINIEGIPSGLAASPFEKIQTSLDSFKLNGQ
ncbi:MAG: hypothetical protein EXR74_00610 [Bdellovibrionales bacterium]|nr:hypothetical protein [Bdellovibrionales bacterium]